MNPHAPVIYAWTYTSILGTSPTFACDRNPYYWRVDPEGQQLPYLDRQS